MTVTLEQLKSICVPSTIYPWSSAPVLRSRDGVPWTVATASGHVLLAVRGRLTDNIDGPSLTFVTREKMAPARVVSFAALKKFVAKKQPKNEDGAECVGIAGVPVDAVKLRRVLGMVTARTVTLRSSATKEPYGPVGHICPRHLHIHTPRWIIIVAAYAVPPFAEFPAPNRKAAA